MYQRSRLSGGSPGCPVYTITDEATSTLYELSTAVDLSDYVGQRVTISGIQIPRPPGPPLLKVTQVLQEGEEALSPRGLPEDCVLLLEAKAQAKEEAKKEAKEEAAKEEALSPLERVAQKLKELVRSSIAFNTPTEMQVGKTETIELLLSTSSSAEELKQQLTETGKKEGVDEIPTAERMQARLTGDPGFIIQAITPEEQAISSEGTTRWSWDVTPTQAGEDKNYI